MEKYNNIGAMLVKCMSAVSMDQESNVERVFRSRRFPITFNSNQIYIARAKSFLSGTLADCLVNDVLDIIGTAQVLS